MTSVYVTRSVRAVDSLKTIPAPMLCVPHTPEQTHRTEKLHEYVGYLPSQPAIVQGIGQFSRGLQVLALGGACAL